MPPLRSRIAHYSRSKPFIIKWFFIMMAGFGALSIGASFFHDWFMGTSHAAIWTIHTLVAIVGGAVWFVIFGKICGIQSWRSYTLLLGLCCFVLGWLSADATGFIVPWHEEITGLRENGEPLNDLLYNISGTGVREELIKLLFFLPIALVIAKRRELWEMVFAASCVGLGFAVNENILYSFYLGEGPAAMVSRGLVTNFLHSALTGMTGLALCRFLQRPTRQWETLLTAFIFAVLLHGLWNSMGITELTGDFGSILSIFILGYLSHWYFGEIHKVRITSRQHLSPLSVFVFGMGLNVGLALIYAALSSGDWRLAVSVVGNSALGIAAIGFLYIREFGDE